MTATRSNQYPFTEGSGTSSADLTGSQNLSLPSIGGGAAWVNPSGNSGFDVNDNVAWEQAAWTTSGATYTALNGATAFEFEVLVDLQAMSQANAIIYSIDANGSASTKATLSVTSAGVLTVTFWWSGNGGASNHIITSSGAVAANTRYLLRVKVNTADATSTDRVQLWINDARVTPATYAAPTQNATLDLGTSNLRFALGGYSTDALTILGIVFWASIASGNDDATEATARYTALIADDDTAPTEGGDEQEITPTGIAGSAAFETHRLDHYLAPTGLSGAAAFQAHTLVPGAVSVTAPELTGSAAFGTHTTTLYCTPAPIDGAAALVAPTLSPGAVTILHTELDGLAAFGSHALGLFLTPGIVTGSADFQTHALVPGAVAITPGVIDGDADVPDPELLTGNFIAAGELAGQGLLGSHTVVPGGVTITHSALAGSGLLGAHTVSPGAATVVPSALDGSAVLGSHTVAPGAATVTAPTLTGAAAFHAPTVSPGDVLISPAALAGSGLLGSPALGLYLALAPLAGSGALGSHALSLGAPTINPTALAGLGLFGSHAVTGGLQFAGARLDTSESFLLRHSNLEDLALRYGCAESLDLP